MKLALVIAVLVTSMFVLGGIAVAGNAVVTGHSAAPPLSAKLVKPGPPSGTSSGTLPFTGIDLAGIAGVSAVLVAGGLILRRTARKQR